MTTRRFLWSWLGLLLILGAARCPGEWQVARPGWVYAFPRDHGSHPSFKTEWWYFTGNLTSAGGQKFGYQLTFFRQGVRDDAQPHESRFVTRDLKLAHFAVTDLSANSFRFWQKLSRGAYGEAGFSVGQRLAWIDDWSCELLSDPPGNTKNKETRFRLRAQAESLGLNLTLVATKNPVIHGSSGVSQKSEGEGRASHYYSLTRLQTEGILTMEGKEIPVSGLSWFDHEWATNQLAKDQVGWDWFSLQFDDGSELMLFQLRQKGGGRDAFSAGTFVVASGETTAIAEADFDLKPTRFWKNPDQTGAYPVAWRMEIPKLNLKLQVLAARDDQELRLQPVVYWEGSVQTEGTREGKAVKGSGYLEMTGYAGPVAGMMEGR